MFTLDVDQDLTLSLVDPSFSTRYLDIVSQEREYLSRWLAWPAFADSEVFFSRFIQQAQQDYAAGTSMVCAMKLDEEIVGNICFKSIDHTVKKVEIGYWLSEQHQGKGVVTKSVAALIAMAFNELNMDKVELFVATENRPSRNVCERLGFALEAIITEAEALNGRVYDHVQYGLKRTDLEAQTYLKV